MTDWNKLKVVDLKAELKKLGLAQTGLKPVLVARLTAAENEDGTESEATVQGDAGRQDVATSSDTVSPIQQTSDPHTEVFPDAPLQATTEPKLESPAQDAASTDSPKELPIVETQASPLPVQATTIIELSQPPPQSQDSHQSALPSAEPQEIMDDRRKRKRRSQSPAPSISDSARKRARQDETSEVNTEIVTSQDDATWVEKHNAVDSAEVNAEAMEVASSGEGVEPGPTIVDVAKEEVEIQGVPRANLDENISQPQNMDFGEENMTKEVGGLDEQSPSRMRDSRFKDLFPTQPKASSLEKSIPRDSAVDAMDIDTDRVVSPAVHPATSALYIRDFMRPLNPGQLKSHLIMLATPPGHSPVPDVIVNFYLDPIRTHALVSLTSVSAAVRIRSSIHDLIWPDERTRKPLWADFIPAEKVEDWINEEQSTISGGRAAGKKWEVHYDTNEDNNVTATLQEVNSFPQAQPVPWPSDSLPSPQVPTKPRGIEGAPLGPRADTQVRAANSFSTLDRLFEVTTAKPALYYKPVSKELADRRLDKIDFATSKKTAGRPISGEINRYTFEDNDVLVDRGPEIFTGIRPPRGYRGPGPASRGGSRGGGPYQSRSAYSGGRSDRGGYDSYRGGRRNSRDNRPTAEQLYQKTSTNALPIELQDSIRFYTARLTQAAGILLRLPQDITAQANVLLFRYWLVDGLLDHEFSDISAATLYLTAKISASPRSLRSITNVYAYLLSPAHNDPDSYYLSESSYISFRNRLLLVEGHVLNALGFNTHVALPHPLAITYLQTLDVFNLPGNRGKDVARRTIAYLNAALLSPQMLYLTHQPAALATAAIYLAAREVG
ncbi:Cyclin, partial [Lachnellula occidentalis]